MVLSEEIAVSELNNEKKKNEGLLNEIKQNHNISNVPNDSNGNIVINDHDIPVPVSSGYPDIQVYQEEIITLKNQIQLLSSKNDIMISDVYPKDDNPYGDFGVITPQGGQDLVDSIFGNGANKDFYM